MATTRADSAVNEAVELRAIFRQRKILYSPYEVRLVEIYKSDPAVGSPPVEASYVPSEVSTGIFKITTADDLLDETGLWYDKWYFTWENGETETDETQDWYVNAEREVIPGSECDLKGYAFNNPDATENDGWGAIITPDELRYVYAFGNELVAPNNQTITDDTLRWYITTAIGNLERDLNVKLIKRIYKYRPPQGDSRSLAGTAGIDYEWEEPYDFDRQTYNKFIYIKLRNRPIISIDTASFYDVASNYTLDILTWLKINYNKGSIQAFPVAGSLESLAVFAGNVFSYQNYAAGYNFYPDAFYFDYTAGFENAATVWKKWPELFSVVGRLAAINLLNDYGDGKTAALASSSIGLSGISESFSTTLSATSAAFGARIKQYENELKTFYKHNKNKYSGLLIGGA